MKPNTRKKAMGKKPIYHNVPLTEKEIEGILAAVQCAEHVRSGTNGVMAYRRQQRIRACLRRVLKGIERSRKASN